MQPQSAFLNPFLNVTWKLDDITLERWVCETLHQAAVTVTMQHTSVGYDNDLAAQIQGSLRKRNQG